MVTLNSGYVCGVGRDRICVAEWGDNFCLLLCFLKWIMNEFYIFGSISLYFSD